MRKSERMLLLYYVVQCVPLLVTAFGVPERPCRGRLTKSSSSRHLRLAASSSDSKFGDVTVDLPPSGSGIKVKLNFEPVLSVPSEAVEVRYGLPFDLSIEPQKGLAVCTKDGPGGEKVGDVLRFASQWTIGLPRGGGDIAATVAAFSGGGLGWQCSMFDVMRASTWEQVVEALTSNVPSRTDEVVLVFERSLEGLLPNFSR